ncbi:MAG: hypothetical protein QM731_01845 [Chitinophagaceae bacterium]
MKHTALLLFIAFISCNKKDSTPNNTISTDAQRHKLKEVTVQNLPSPYFLYQYDANNFVTTLNHESGFYQYTLEYRNNRLYQLVNNTAVNHDTLRYYYNEGKVVRIDLLQPNEGKTEETGFQYDNSGRLTQVTWKKMTTGAVFKKMLFTYNQQSNLSKAEIYYQAGNGLQKLNEYQYLQYDDKINLTSGYLLKEAHFLFLPQVHLQKNNPIQVKLLGVTNDFEYNNTYVYNDSLPTVKTMVMTQTRGTGTGTTITGVTRYTYY